MIKYIKRYTFLFAGLSLLSFAFTSTGCTQKTEPKRVVSVNNVNVNPVEFELRYKFNPYFKDLSPSQAKKQVLSSLIAEKLLYLEAKDSFVNQDIINLIQQYQKEAAIEQIKKDSIEQKVNISGNDLWQEYLKSLKEIEIEYVAYKSLEEAKFYHDQIVDSKSFKKIILSYMASKNWEEKEIPKKIIKWNSEPYYIEDTIYNLAESAISQPLKAYGSYYLIRVVDIKESRTPEKDDFISNKRGLENKLRNQLIKMEYNEFFNRHIRNNLPDIYWETLHPLADFLAGYYEFPMISLDQRSIENQPLKELHSLEKETDFANIKDNTAMKFSDGTEWKVNDLMQNLQIGPYAFNFKNVQTFKRSFARNIQLIAEHETLYKYAVKKGYLNNELVVEQTQMWASYYSANSYRYQLLDSLDNMDYTTEISKSKNYSQLTEKEKKRLTFMDEFLVSLLEKHDVKINTEIYQSINSEKYDIVVQKTHFANRLVAPPLEPLYSLPKWNKAISEIFKKKDI